MPSEQEEKRQNFLGQVCVTTAGQKFHLDLIRILRNISAVTNNLFAFMKENIKITSPMARGVPGSSSQLQQ